MGLLSYEMEKMMQVSKIALLAVGACTLLTGCAEQKDSGWRNDCAKNYSYDSRENSVCRERVESGKSKLTDGPQSAVSTDALDASRPIEGSRETEKAHRD